VHRIHIGGLPVQVHWNDCCGFRCDGGFNLRSINERIVAAAIHQYRSRTGKRNALGAGKERVGYGNHFLARANIVCTQRQLQCRGTRCEANAILGSAVCCELLLELLHVWSAGKRAFVHNGLHCGIYLLLYGAILRL
jgi:hypothetical protein